MTPLYDALSRELPLPDVRTRAYVSWPLTVLLAARARGEAVA